MEEVRQARRRIASQVATRHRGRRRALHGWPPWPACLAGGRGGAPKQLPELGLSKHVQPRQGARHQAAQLPQQRVLQQLLRTLRHLSAAGLCGGGGGREAGQAAAAEVGGRQGGRQGAAAAT